MIVYSLIMYLLCIYTNNNRTQRIYTQLDEDAEDLIDDTLDDTDDFLNDGMLDNVLGLEGSSADSNVAKSAAAIAAEKLRAAKAAETDDPFAMDDTDDLFKFT
jgi:uncharacterized protein YciI